MNATGNGVPHCSVTQVHVVPLQVMIGQLMRSDGKCIYCGRTFNARTSDTQDGMMINGRV